MDADKTDDNSGDSHASQRSEAAVPPVSPPSTSSRNLGDTQPYRPAKAHRPLSSKSPLEEQDYRQTAPYRPVPRVKAPPPRKGLSLAIVLGILALLLALAAAIAYFTIMKRGAGTGGDAVSVESALPANISGYISISSAPAESQRQAFGKILDIFEAQPGSKEAAAELITQARNIISGIKLSLGSATDPATLETVANYLGGNVTVAVLALSEGDLLSLKAPPGGQVSPLAAFDVLSRKVVLLVDLDFTAGGPQQGIIAALRAVKDNLDKAKVVERYNGTDIRQYTGGSLPIYFSLLNGTSTAAIGISSAPVKVVIDELRANRGLKEDARFKYLSGRVPAERVATLYLNLDRTNDALKSLMPDFSNGLQMNGATLLSLSGQEGGAQIDIATQGGFSIRQGLLFSLYGRAVRVANVYVNPSLHPDSSTLTDVPADSMAFLVGSDLKSSVSALSDVVETVGGNAITLQEMIKSITGLDPNSDVLPLMGGDYAVSTHDYDISRSGAPIVAQLKLAEANVSKATVTVARGAQKISYGKAQSFNAAGSVFYSFADVLSETAIGVAKGRALMVIGPDRAAVTSEIESVAAGLGRGIGTADKWKAPSQHLLPNSNLIGYMDVTTIREITERGITDDETKAVYNMMFAPFLRPIKYVIAGSSSDPTGVSEPGRNLIRIFIGVSK